MKKSDIRRMIKEEILNEVTKAGNTAYINADGTIKIQLPYPLVGFESKVIVPESILFSVKKEERSKVKEIAKIVKKLNNDLNKEFDAFEEKAKELIKNVENEAKKILK